MAELATKTLAANVALSLPSANIRLTEASVHKGVYALSRAIPTRFGRLLMTFERRDFGPFSYVVRRCLRTLSLGEKPFLQARIQPHVSSYYWTSEDKAENFLMSGPFGVLTEQDNMLARGISRGVAKEYQKDYTKAKLEFHAVYDTTYYLDVGLRKFFE